jgi:hypothetical protein
MRLAVAAPPAHTIRKIPIARRGLDHATITIPVMTAAGPSGRQRPASFGTAHRSIKRRSGTSAPGLIRAPAKVWCEDLENVTAPGGISLSQHRKHLEFFGRPALPSGGLSWRIFSRKPSTRLCSSLSMSVSLRSGWAPGAICGRRATTPVELRRRTFHPD